VADTDSPATPDLERKLATILSADVAAYSRLMAEDEEHTLRTFRGHKEVFEKLVQLHRGRVFNTAGDAILAEFGSAVEAVRCATEIQAALRTRNDQLPEDRQVRFRIGVNLGDVMVQGQDLLGDGVNVAARLQGAAEPGGVCIAGSVYDQIRNKLSLSFTPLGEMSYKNIPQPVRTFAIAEADGVGTLPAPVHQRQIGGRRLWAVAAVVLLLGAAGGAVWGYSDYQRRQAEAAQAAALANQKTAAEQARQQAAAKAAQQQAELAAEKRAAEEARQRAEAEQRSAEAAQQRALAEQKRIESEAHRLAEAKRNRSEATQLAAVAAPPRVAPPRPDPPRSPAALPSPRSGDSTGVYGGPICYGPGEADPARCFRAQAILRNNTISGQWPARVPGSTMHLAGDISPSGDVAIHMHAVRADGSRFAIIDMVGKLREGRIDANGSFRNGRSVTLNWRKN
jgi:class 3 adenylate cyclase